MSEFKPRHAPAPTAAYSKALVLFPFAAAALKNGTHYLRLVWLVRETLRHLAEGFKSTWHAGGTVPLPTEVLGTRLADAESFLRIGRHEVETGMAANNTYAARQGFEKLFHALSSGYVAVVFAYRRYSFYPTSHDAVEEGLEIAGLRREARFFREMREIFHNKIYYQGETNLFPLAQQYIETLENEVAAARNRIGTVG